MPTSHPILDRLASAIDLDDPTPAWHQLAAIVRWEVAQGRLPIGTELPPIRSVAKAVGLNYHTVRTAWAALAGEGVISQRQGRGARIVRAARVTGGWVPAPADSTAEDGELPRVWIVDRSIERAARLAARLVTRWNVVALPYPPSADAPPPGPILLLATADGGGDWPGREREITVVEPVLDPATVSVVRRNAGILAVGEVAVVTGEDDRSPAVADLLRQLPRLGLRVRRQVAAPATHDTGVLWLHLPAAWQRLDWESRSRPDVMGVEFDWAPGPLAGVAKRLGWRATNG